jgi:hypothetical protein
VVRTIPLALLLPLLTGATQVPLTLHVNAKDGEQWIKRAVAVANDRFSGADVKLAVRRTLPFSAPGPEITTVAQRNRLARRVKRDRTIHVFLVERLANKDRKGGWIGGVHWRARARRYIIVSRREALEDTLAHELGHYFGLRHTKAPRNLMTSPGREQPSRLTPRQLRRIRARARRKLW